MLTFKKKVAKGKILNHAPVKKRAVKVKDDSPDNAVELQDWLYDLWCDIMENSQNDKAKIAKYNTGARKYNKITGAFIMAEITDIKKQSKAFREYQAAILEQETANVLKKSPVSETAVALGKTKKVATTTPRKPRASSGGKSQKQICIEAHAAGLTAEQCAEQYGLSLTNVKWYYRYVIELGTRK